MNLNSGGVREGYCLVPPPHLGYIFALTGVQPERQKVVCKGVTLKDEAWANFKLTNNALVLVMGSKEEDVPAAPLEPVRFVEDMNESELASLINLGNTCYMNATVQCLKTVPELKNALLGYDKKQYFGGTLDVELVCSEADEPRSKSSESFLQLSCFISQDVKYLQSGLKSKMSEQITKLSQTLGRDAIYTKTSKISRLPAYLTVQFVRFYFKEKESINAKILKDVKFPLELDVYDLCSPELQERLTPMRSKFKELEDAATEKSLSTKNKNHGDSKKDPSKKTVVPYWFENAVLTHRGRSSSSGHYVAWVARNDGWLRCDDDTVTPVSEEDVLKLSGGGDWHCAYLLLYGPKVLELPLEAPEPMVTEVMDEGPAGNPPTAQA
ncbi:Ubiquitin carboxyl-terminal hydrolase 14 [Operophtera brumata]|uniref:ubiquitinyl hydrolase 1 n=1 Tax=Operophtera brumata TaxID=104452 RepID=A0A0L7KRH1_OPEBR|nr:Ubiquitin carboxyl-terminal hydrolase 14 [Operophtera brumata]